MDALIQITFQKQARLGAGGGFSRWLDPGVQAAGYRPRTCPVRSGVKAFPSAVWSHRHDQHRAGCLQLCLCFSGDLGQATFLHPSPPWAMTSDVPSTRTPPVGSAGSYLAIEPIEGHGGVGRPQHAHGGRRHVREDGPVPPPPLLLLRARGRVRALRPPRRLHGPVSGRARAPPCSQPPQPRLGTSCPAAPRPETPLCPLRNAGRGPEGTPAPAAHSAAAPCRPPEPSHRAGKHGRPSRPRADLARPALSRETCAEPPLPRLPGSSGRRLRAAELRRPGCQETVSSRFAS